MTTSSTRRADAQRNIDAVVSATSRLVAAGEPLPTVADIAAEAGVGVATVYRSFSSRRRLIGEAHAIVMCDELAPLVETLVTGDDPVGDMLALSHAIVGTARTHLARIEGGELPTARFVDRFVERYGPGIATALAKAQSEGLLRPDLEEADIAGVTAFFVGGLTQTAASSPRAERYVALWFDAVTTGPRSYLRVGTD